MAAIEAQGMDGTVTFDGEWLMIARKGFVARTLKGGRGEVRLHVGQITGIELRKPGITGGHFTVIAAGGVQRSVGNKAHESDPLSVSMHARQYQPFVALRAAVEEAMAARQAPVPAAAAAPGLGDQMAKLAELHQQGLLSDEEFAAAKARLLAG